MSYVLLTAVLCATVTKTGVRCPPVSPDTLPEYPLHFSKRHLVDIVAGSHCYRKSCMAVGEQGGGGREKSDPSEHLLSLKTFFTMIN